MSTIHNNLILSAETGHGQLILIKLDYLSSQTPAHKSTSIGHCVLNPYCVVLAAGKCLKEMKNNHFAFYIHIHTLMLETFKLSITSDSTRPKQKLVKLREQRRAQIPLATNVQTIFICSTFGQKLCTFVSVCFIYIIIQFVHTMLAFALALNIRRMLYSYGFKTFDGGNFSTVNNHFCTTKFLTQILIVLAILFKILKPPPRP